MITDLAAYRFTRDVDFVGAQFHWAIKAARQTIPDRAENLRSYQNRRSAASN
jgi:hypothetical protein